MSGNVLRKVGLTAVDMMFIVNFGQETIRLRRELERLKQDPDPPNSRKLLIRVTEQEVDLRERRIKQWVENPSGKPKDPLKPVTEYS